MVIDTSVLIAILFLEPDRRYYQEQIERASYKQVSAVSYMEAGMVLTSRFGSNAEMALDELLTKAGVTISPVNGTQAKLALAAFREYGKGRHPAGLNFGDCFSYALAKSSAEPLLFKGSDFARTDITVA
jgi:ribonuclease VapC